MWFERINELELELGQFCGDKIYIAFNLLYIVMLIKIYAY